MKQVVVIRKDLNMRRGKEIAQAAHAVTQWLIQKVLNSEKLTKEESDWVSNGSKKVTLQVSSEKELMDLASSARKANLKFHVITDAGITEFNGVATKTCIAIGPDTDEAIDKITGTLKLY